MLFFRLSSLELLLLIVAVVVGATFAGIFFGHRLRAHAATLKEPAGVVQAALLGLVALVLAFGLTMAVGRYDGRRAAVVDDANAIGTTYLRAQTLREPIRSQSLADLVQYADASLRLSHVVPGTNDQRAVIADENALQRKLWRQAGEALAGSPTDSAPRLYVDSLNDMIDMQTVRVAALANRVPTPVLGIELLGAAAALGLLAFYLALAGRGFVTVLFAGVLVCLLLLITFDLDRPKRGLVKVSDAPLVALRASMALPPAAAPPGG
jgi:hypothetical protein